MNSQQSTPGAPLQAWPKIDLHRHLEGSIRLDTMLDLVARHDLDLPRDRQALSRLVQVQPDDPCTATSFLSKFATIRKFFCAPEIIERITREAIEDAAADGIRYLELRFTPVALSRIKQFQLGEVMDWVAASANDAAQRLNMSVRLIASNNKHEPVELADQVARLTEQRMHKGFVGIDLAGNEEAFALAPFHPSFQWALNAGLAIAIHAGEWAGPDNVRQAVDQFGARRIGHGVRVLDDETVVALSRLHGVTFEVCITSNCQSGVVRSPAEHPFRRMRDAGLRASLHTDDPTLSQLTLTDEYQLAIETLGLSRTELKQSILDAADGAFLPAAEKAQLIATMRDELAAC